ncbi:MAG: NAD(P)H-hydrate epimerase [Planctomycetia bacterium]
MHTLTRAQVREVDRLAIEEYGLPGIVLMENAGGNAARLLHSLGIDGPVAIACGRGNNGGDGFVIARHLELLGHDVRLLLAASLAGYSGDAAVNAEVARRSGLRMVDLAAASAGNWLEALHGAAWIVDALLGTGAVGAPRGAVATAIAAIKEVRGQAPGEGGGSRVLAVDIPSGMDGDTGERPGACVRADATATFVAPKPGFAAPGAQVFTGAVHVLGIGAPAALLARFGISRAD